MHIILNFVKQYFIFMLLLFVFSYLVPKENYRRYFNFFISVMMVAALLFPLLQISEKEVAEQTKARLEEIEEKIGDTQYYQKGENIFEQFLSDEGLAETENKEPDKASLPETKAMRKIRRNMDRQTESRTVNMSNS